MAINDRYLYRLSVGDAFRTLGAMCDYARTNDDFDAASDADLRLWHTAAVTIQKAIDVDMTVATLGATLRRRGFYPVGEPQIIDRKKEGEE